MNVNIINIIIMHNAVINNIIIIRLRAWSFLFL